jgi:hypothetical protein
MALATNLSAKDQSVLLTILSGGEAAAINHTSGTSRKRISVDVELPPDRHVSDVEHLVDLEKKAIMLIDNDKDYAKAADIFGTIISQEPSYASVYNNRAQLRRILVSEKESGVMDVSEDTIVADLRTCISLAQPGDSGQSEIKVSKMQASLLQSAYTQLAAVYLAKAEGDNKWEYEEKASDCFYYAGEYGSEIARAMASKVNPYAKLCGNIVQEALARERGEH